MRIVTGLLSMLLCAGCATAQAQPTAPAPTTAATPPSAARADGVLSPDSSVDEVLDALETRGKGLRSFTADVTLSTSDPALGPGDTQTGRVLYQTRGDNGADARIRVTFDTTARAGGQPKPEKVEYVLSNGNLIERLYRTKTQTTRQVLRPGEQLNLLKLGEGPFPLPIGQPKAEVH